MQPVIAIVGRPNVGKSTLFNCLTRTRDALVADQPGLTRDRKYGEGIISGKKFIAIDTGGLSDEGDELYLLMADQVWLAVDEADFILFVVDARDGLLGGDRDIANRLRQTSKPVSLVVNKIDGVDVDLAVSEFHGLGMGEPQGITATHGRGVTTLIDGLLDGLAHEEFDDDDTKGIKIAVVGKPNVGKSTLINRMLGEERVLTFNMPGTTRDTVYIPYHREGTDYTLIDTAGVRRKGKVTDKLEKFSVIKALQAVERAHVVIMVIDAQQGISDQDSHLLGFTLDAGKALVIAVNKWDGLSAHQKQTIKRELQRKLQFIDFAKLHFISALHGTGVGNLYKPINRAYHSATKNLVTPLLTKILQNAVEAHQPPLVRGRRIKLRYAHQGGRNPPVIIIHGNQTDKVPASYRRYLSNTYRDVLRLEGTPVRIEFKTASNPYQGRSNTLTTRQISKKQRLKRFINRKKHR